jgi:hypothetical protein
LRVVVEQIDGGEYMKFFPIERTGSLETSAEHLETVTNSTIFDKIKTLEQTIRSTTENQEKLIKE